MKNIVYFELNEWSPEYYPDKEPYVSWIVMTKEKNYYIRFRDENWVKENQLVIVESIVDMSINFCVSAKREWVEKNCPDLLTTYSEFLREPEEGKKLPKGMFRCPFLEWSEENIGTHKAYERKNNQDKWIFKIEKKSFLILPIKGKWFRMILDGIKNEEYRERKPYWEKRFKKYFGYSYGQISDDEFGWHFPPIEKDIIFRNGYGKDVPEFTAKVRICEREGNPEWGAVPGEVYYVLEIGRIFNVKNCD